MKTKILAAALGGAFLLAAPVSGQQAGMTAGSNYQYWSVCGGTPSGTTLATCAAVDIWYGGTTADGKNLLEMRVWNLSDMAGASSPNWAFTRIAFSNTNVTVTEGTVHSMSSDYEEAGANPWGVKVTNGNFAGGVDIDFQGGSMEDDKLNSSVDDAIQTRCRTDDPGGEQWMSGCASEFNWASGATGWVQLSFTYTGTWDFEQSFVTIQAQNGDEGESIQCITGGDKENCGDVPPPTVVPEPMTLLLLGTGLAGVGLVGVRRRREGISEQA